MKFVRTVPAAYHEQKGVRSVRAHHEMSIHNERTGFPVLCCIVTDDSKSKIPNLAETYRPTNQC